MWHARYDPPPPPPSLLDGLMAVEQVIAVFAGRGEGADGIGFVDSVTGSGPGSKEKTQAEPPQEQPHVVGVVLDTSSFYAEGGGQVGIWLDAMAG